MYKTLFAVQSTKLLFGLRQLDIWNSTGFELSAVFDNMEAAIQAVKNKNFDLVITEVYDINFTNFITQLKNNACHNIIAVSEELTLENVRQCIKTNVSDYFVLPFESSKFAAALEKIRREMLSYRNDASIYANELLVLFNTQDVSFFDKANEIAENMYNNTSGIKSSDRAAEELLKNLADMIFEKNDWLDLYINKDDIYRHDDSISEKQFFITSLTNFFTDFLELHPAVHNDKIQQVILYILNNPESELKQKSIAASLYMNSSYLSTIFTAHTEQRFVDYLTNVKLRRAAWLLRNTPLKVTDIAEKLDYKDIGYFSRLFKKKYGITPSDYRLPDHYEFYI